jgi:hypothetical protein
MHVRRCQSGARAVLIAIVDLLETQAPSCCVDCAAIVPDSGSIRNPLARSIHFAHSDGRHAAHPELLARMALFAIAGIACLQ